MKIEDAIEYAAQHLPERMTLSIEIEKDSAWLDLCDIAEGVNIDLQEAGVCMDLSLADQIVAAVDIARRW